MRTYDYPLFIADGTLQRLHVDILDGLFEDVSDLRKKCDIGNDMRLISFKEAVRLYNEEGHRTCGNCLEGGGEVSNWKERAERAESDIRGLQSQLEQADKLAADWKERAETAEAKLGGEGQ